jgi:membrane protein implicated in regulation of membrane protease activity
MLIRIAFGAVLLLLVGAAVLVFHYVPFEATSFAAWTGIALAAVSAVLEGERRGEGEGEKPQQEESGVGRDAVDVGARDEELDQRVERDHDAPRSDPPRKRSLP